MLVVHSYFLSHVPVAAIAIIMEDANKIGDGISKGYGAPTSCFASLLVVPIAVAAGSMSSEVDPGLTSFLSGSSPRDMKKDTCLSCDTRR